MYGRQTSDRGIWVVHECEVVRRGLGVMLTAMGCQVGEFGRDDELPQLPNRALVVASMTVVKRLLEDAAPTLVVIAVLDAFGDLCAREMLRMGVRGLLQVGTTSEELAACLQKLRSGGRYIPLELATAMAENAYSPELTSREFEVLQCLAAGLPNKAVGEKVGITEGTVKSHVTSILSKLGASGRTEAVQISVRRGLIAVPHPARLAARSAGPLRALNTRTAEEPWPPAAEAQGERDAKDGIDRRR